MVGQGRPGSFLYPTTMHLTKDQGSPSSSAFSTFPYEARSYLTVSKNDKAELISSENTDLLQESHMLGLS